VILVDNEADIKGFADFKAESGAQTQAQKPAPQTITPSQPKEQKQAPKQAVQASGEPHHPENFKGVPRTNVLSKISLPPFLSYKIILRFLV